MNVDALTRDIERHGAAAAMQALSMRALNRVCLVQILHGIQIRDVDDEPTPLDTRFEHGFLDGESLLRFARDPAAEVSEDFARGALARGDRCYGIVEGDTLASYCWYSRRPTPISDDLILHFSDAFAYNYKGFTHPNYRGQRLHAIGMRAALRRFRAAGLEGMLAYVDSTNLASLKSCARMGFHRFGNLYVARVMGRYLLSRDAGCEAYGFRVAERGRYAKARSPEAGRRAPA